MTGKVTRWLLLATVFTQISCLNHSPSETMAFDNVFHISEFPVTFELKDGQLIELGLIGVESLCVQDSLLIVSTSDATGFWSFFHLPDLRFAGKFLAKGRAGNEVLASPRVAWQSFEVKDRDLHAAIYDFYSGSILDMNVTRLLDGNADAIRKTEVNLPKSLFNVVKIDSLSFFCREPSPNHTELSRYVARCGERICPKYMEALNAASVDAGYDINILGCYYGYNPTRRIIAEASMDMNLINLYSIDNGTVNATLCPAGRLDRIKDIQDIDPRQKKTAYCNLVAYDSFFAALYYGDTAENIHYGKARKQQIQIFGWTGTPIAAITLDKPANSFDFDMNRGKIYTLNYESEEIYEYNCPDILEYIEPIE